MVRTLIDYAREREFQEQRAALPWFQRQLCKFGVHRWHARAHEYRTARLLRAFTESTPELMNLPWKKMDSQRYTYVPGSEPYQ